MSRNQTSQVVLILLLVLQASINCQYALAFSTTRPYSRLIHTSSPVTTSLMTLTTVAESKARLDLMPLQTTEEKSPLDARDAEAVPSTMPDAIIRFFFGPDHGPIAVVVTLLSMAFWRMQLCVSHLSTLDFLAFGTTVVFWWFQEHFLHHHVLHSKFNWMGKEIHQGHHNKPYFHVSIDPLWLMMSWLWTAHVVLRCCLPSLELALSASMGYIIAGLVYEWAHYITHTRVKPPNAFWKRVRDHHIRHHLVNNDYWFSFTIPAIDDVFGTNPSVAQARVSNEKAREERTS